MIEQSEEYALIGEAIKKELFPQLADIQIAWLKSDKAKKAKGKIIFAECAKVSDKYAWCCPYDFTITVYQPNAAYMSEEQLRILLEHELLHVGEDGSIVPHDVVVEDFRAIIDRYGVDWADAAGE